VVLRTGGAPVGGPRPSQVWLAALAVAVLLATPSESIGQQAEPLDFAPGAKSLVFGTLIPGQAARVDPGLDVSNRAEFRVIGRQSDGVVWFEMPSELVHARDQASIPVFFRAGDGIHVQAIGGGQVPFDPSVDQLEVRHRGNNTETTIYIGGTARPTAHQAGGDYEATITAFIIPDS
jgi:hypothetical protein